ncbi:hypothetical protein [Kitasatospora sp. LaBMicrA B282]|uniref:hypothetical protein n=1 Tax=Kitasatospora sp. LaBMicrA B282 TaxID=3420949 RepID=UPI003D0A04A8
MLTHVANRDSSASAEPAPTEAVPTEATASSTAFFWAASFWPRVREFAVPAAMIETATARRHAGDWAGACAAAAVDVDLDLRAVRRTHGRELAARVRADLRLLAPDLLRWHLPRIAPDGLLRPGLTIALARYAGTGHGRASPLHLVVRTPPAWADAGQRISLALWDGTPAAAWPHPHPHPNRLFRLDLHRHLWDAGRSDELRGRCGADRPPAVPAHHLGHGWAVDRWAAEARVLLAAEGRQHGSVLVRLGARRRLILDLAAAGPGAVAAGSPPTATLRDAPPRTGDPGGALPVLPDAAARELPDLALLRSGLVDPDRLHPLVAAALLPDRPPTAPGASLATSLAAFPDRGGRPWLVECRGEQHRIGLVDGVLAPLDHDPAELRREELLVALTGTPLPCLQVVDRAHRHPAGLDGIRERLNHGDTAGALAAVEDLLGPDALLRGGVLRDEIEAAVQRRLSHERYREGLGGPAPAPATDRRSRRVPRRSLNHRGHPRNAGGR